MLVWIKLGWRNLWRNKRRTIIELSAIGGSVFIGIFMNNHQMGTFSAMIENGVRMGSGHVGVYHEDYLENRQVEMTVDADRLMDELEAMPHVKGVYPRLLIPSLVRSSRDSRSGMASGVDFNREKDSNPLLRTAHFTEGGIPQKKNGALMGYKLAKELGLHLGSKFVLMSQDVNGEITGKLFRIEGLLNTHVSDIDNGLVMVNRIAASEMIGVPGSAHEIGIILENRKYIDEVLAHTRSVIDGGPHTQAYHWKDAMPELYSLAEIKHKGVVVVVMLLFILVGIGNINTLLMSVMERIREFGVLRAIGVKKSGIRVIVMAETVMLAIVGVLAGTIGGTLLSWYFSIKGIDISGLMKEQGMSGAMLDPVLYPTIDIPGMLVFIIGMFIITLVAGFYPTFQVLKARPSEAMRVY